MNTSKTACFPAVHRGGKLSDNGTKTRVHRQESKRKTSDFTIGKRKRMYARHWQDIGLQWNPKKCNVIHVRGGKQVEDAEDLKLDKATLVKNLEVGSSYKFPGVKESTLQDEKLPLTVAAEVYLYRLSVI